MTHCCRMLLLARIRPGPKDVSLVYPIVFGRCFLDRIGQAVEAWIALPYGRAITRTPVACLLRSFTLLNDSTSAYLPNNHRR